MARSSMAINRMRLLVSLNVLPYSTANNVTDVSSANSNHLSNAPITKALLMKLADFKHSQGCQLGQIVLFTASDAMRGRVCMMSFFISIFHVIERGTKEKMLGINARRIITGMANKHTIWNRATIKLIGCAASNVGFPADSDSSISFAPFSANPYPASVIATTSIGMFEKSFFEWNAWGSHKFSLLKYVVRSTLISISRVLRTSQEGGIYG